MLDVLGKVCDDLIFPAEFQLVFEEQIPQQLDLPSLGRHYLACSCSSAPILAVHSLQAISICSRIIASSLSFSSCGIDSPTCLGCGEEVKMRRCEGANHFCVVFRSCSYMD